MASKDFDKLKQLNAELINLGGSSLATLLAGKQEAMVSGTWTPVISPAGGSVSHLAQSGYYFKIGELVVALFTVSLSAISSPTGQVKLAGLPFTISNVSAGRNGQGFITNAAGFAANTPSVLWGINGTTTGEFAYRTAANTASNNLLQGSDLGSTSQIWGAIIYRAA